MQRAPAAHDAGGDGVDGGARQLVGLADVEGEVAATEPLVIGQARAGQVAHHRRGERPQLDALGGDGGGVVPGHALHGGAAPRRSRRGGSGSARWAGLVARFPGAGAAYREGAVLGDGAGERPGAGEHLGPAGGPSGHGDDAQPGGSGARDGVVGGGHEHAAVGEGVVDVAEDAAQARRQRRQLSIGFHGGTNPSRVAGNRLVTVQGVCTIQRDVKFWFLDENQRETDESGCETRAGSARWGEARRALPVERGRESPPLNGYIGCRSRALHRAAATRSEVVARPWRRS